MLHVGTDEAGYGPLLGPLVIAAAAFETPGGRDALPAEGLDDSKVIFARGGRAALADALAPFWGGRGRRLSDLLARHSIRGDPRGGYAWYGDVAGDGAGSPASEPPAAFRRLYVNPVCERDFNRGCEQWGGKGGLLFAETAALVRRALADHPGCDAEVVCDKHGGRNRYAALLLAEFAPSAIVAERETAAWSAYRLVLDGRRVRIVFRQKADGTDPAAALASMAAKYVRELFMEGLNAYFRGRIEGLRPTAGYYEDGRRFLDEVRPVLDELGPAADDFVRRR